jgi:hypothetical protein
MAAPVVLKVDLKPMIRAAATSRVQFAVPVPHRASAAKDGNWRVVGSRSEWHYAVQIPTAVSMSFHAAKVHLPPSAYLTVASAKTIVTYRAIELRKPDLWSRVQPGDALQFTLSVAASERDSVVFELDSLQAGYRALGPQAQNHPYYQQLVRAAAGDNTDCVQNYQCSVTPANTPVGQAAVGILVANMYQCTGTLISDVAADNIPYLLTARHCESGQLGGGYPERAAGITVYWDATTPCNSTLGSIYDPGIAVQTGATTMVEQEDVWLVKLDESPNVADAQFAGFDASGAAVQGGYTIHHALGFDKQLTQWFGSAYPSTQPAALGTTYVSHFLETVNSQGNIGPGASGSGLINGSNRLAGALSLGIKSSDTSGYEACPAASPTAPNGSNASAFFTSLAAVWDSTADTTSTTGSATLKTVLDASNSGTTIVSSTPAVSLNLSASTYSLSDGDPLQISWNASGATQCLASDGATGDGWSATLPATGSVTVNETFSAYIKYTLSCQLSGGRNIIQSITVFWYGGAPSAFLDAFGIRWVGAAATLTWTSNVTPCSITGGGLALANLPSSGTASATQTTPGDVTYIVSCGTTYPASSYTTVSYVTPTLTFRPNSTDRLNGEPFYLYWESYADTCIPSDGAPNDGWSNNALSGSDSFGFRNYSVGTWTYTLTCSSGPNTVSQSTTVTIENDAPYTTASVTPTTVTYTATPADYLSVSWKSNLTDCGVNSSPPLEPEYSTYPLMPSGASDAEDTGAFSPPQPGTYQITVICNSGALAGVSPANSAQLTVQVLPPPAPTAQITVNPSTLYQGQQFTATWSSTNATNCSQEGTAESIGAIWGFDSGVGPSGSQVLSTNEPGTATVGLKCQSIDNSQGTVSAQATITVLDGQAQLPSATLSISATEVAEGQSFTATWSSTNATSCTASGGGADGNTWSGALAIQGTITVTATTAGSFTYTITCGAGTQTSVASQVIKVTGSTAGTGTTSGGHGGGGSLPLFDLCALAVLVGLRARTKAFRSAKSSSRRA